MTRGGNSTGAGERGEPHLIFRVGRQEFVLPSERVLEIRTMPAEEETLLLANGRVAGVIALHGQSVPVFDLGRRYGQPTSRRHARRFVIVLPFESPDGRRFKLGLLVDSISSVVHIALSRISAAGPGAPWACTGRVRINGRFKYVLEPARLLSAAEVAEALGLDSPAISSVA